MSAMLQPTMSEIKRVADFQHKNHVELERFRKHMSDNMDWVRTLGNAHEVEDRVNRKISAMESQFEMSHNV